jgi:hypothetical protein
MRRYFKLACFHEKPEWYIEEFKNGRARFGWSGPGMDLRKIKTTDSQHWSDDERITWRYTKFLIERIEPGDRLVIQVDQPLQRFLIGEVVAPGYNFAPGDLDDFNDSLYEEQKGVGSLFLTGSRLFQTKNTGLAPLHFAARGGELVHLVYLVFLVCLVRRTRETRQTRTGTEKGSGIFSDWRNRKGSGVFS